MPLGPKAQAYYEKNFKYAPNQKSTEEHFDIIALRKTVDTHFKEQLQHILPSESVHVTKKQLCFDSYLVNTTIYKPNSARTPMPVIIFHPGGGLALDMADLHAHICMQMSRTANAAVICIQPPLAPEHKLPEILDTAYQATKYYYQNADEHDFLTSQFIVSGYSMGGTLAALITAKSLSDPELNITAQVMISSVLDLPHPPKGIKEDFMFNESTHIKFIEMCLPTDITLDSLNPSTLSPMQVNFYNAPPTYLIAGEYDAFRQDAEKMYAKLRNEQVNVKLTILPGQIHNTLLLYPLMGDGDNPADSAALFCSEHFTTSHRCRM